MDGITSRVEAIKAGKPADEVIGSASTSEACALGLITGRLDLLSPAYNHPGDAWRRLDDSQRKLVRRHAPNQATRAARAAREQMAKSDGSREPGRPPLGERPLTPAERKRRSREAAGAATLEAIDRAIVAEVQRAAANGARWIPSLLRAVAGHFSDAERDRVIGRIDNQ